MESSTDNTYILTIDQGTTSSRVLVIDHNLKVVDIEQREHQQISQHPGWNEHDPEAIYSNLLFLSEFQINDDLLTLNVVICLEEVCKRNNLNGQNVKAIGITNQRETVVAFDKTTGKSLNNAIVWNDKRTSDIVKQYYEMHSGNLDYPQYKFEEKCGLPINTYFSAVKMRWLLDHVPSVRNANEQNNLVFGTIDTWLIYKLTGGMKIVTDSSNASRTMLMDINSLEWSDFMLQEFDIKKESLPELIVSSSDDFGHIASIHSLEGVPITGVLGDQQAACLGHILKQGEVKNTYGTGCFLLSNVGTKPVQSTHGLLTTICYSLGRDQTYYALEGAVEVAGAAIKWSQSVGLLGNVKELESLCYQVEDCGDVYFVPSFNGIIVLIFVKVFSRIFSPYWRDDARALMIGMSLNTTKAHIARAVLEAPCLRTAEVIEAIQKDSGLKVSKMSVDGGMSVNNFVLQSQADFVGNQIDIYIKAESEITGIGAAIAAGLNVAFWNSLEEVESKIQIDRIFTPQISNLIQIDEETRIKKMKRWEQAVQRSIGFGWE